MRVGVAVVSSLFLFLSLPHPEEHRHTLGEVQRWFAENGVEYVRAYPSALLAGESDELLARAGWIKGLGHKGGLFITVGRRVLRCHLFPLSFLICSHATVDRAHESRSGASKSRGNTVDKEFGGPELLQIRKEKGKR